MNRLKLANAMIFMSVAVMQANLGTTASFVTGGLFFLSAIGQIALIRPDRPKVEVPT